MEQYQKNLIAHAFAVLFVALLAGFMLGAGLIGGVEIFPNILIELPYYGTSEGWARAHAGGIANTLLMIAVALTLPHCNLGSRAAARRARFALYLIFVGWGNTIFYWFGNASDNRALSLTDNVQGAANLLGTIGYAVAVPAALLLLYVSAAMVRGFLRK